MSANVNRTGPPDGPRHETTLRGGTSNRGLVTRQGDTVRRPLRLASPGIHALLRHLEMAGFDGSPRVLGVDEQGREVLSYIQGQAVTPPYPDWALTENALVSVAHLVRRYHDAVQDFDPASYTWGSEVPPPFGGSLVSHNDLNLDNVIFRDGEAVALIDFDLSSPGSRLWDVAMAARLWVPLRAPRDVDEMRGPRIIERLRRFVESYGLSADDRRPFVSAVAATHSWCYDIVRDSAAQGHRGYLDYQNATRDHEKRALTWMTDHADALTSAISADG